MCTLFFHNTHEEIGIKRNKVKKVKRGQFLYFFFLPIFNPNQTSNPILLMMIRNTLVSKKIFQPNKIVHSKKHNTKYTQSNQTTTKKNLSSSSPSSSSVLTAINSENFFQTSLQVYIPCLNTYLPTLPIYLTLL